MVLRLSVSSAEMKRVHIKAKVLKFDPADQKDHVKPGRKSC